MPTYSPARHSTRLMRSLHQQLVQNGTTLFFTTNPAALRTVGAVIAVHDDESAAKDIETPPVEEHNEDEAPVMHAQVFRFFDLPDELWVRIGKMVIDDAPGINTPPKHMSMALFNKQLFKDAAEASPSWLIITTRQGSHQAKSDPQTIAELRKTHAKDDTKNGTAVGDEDATITVLSPRMIAKVCPGCFPPPPAITQSSALLRRELLTYFYKTKVDLVFNWRDTIGDVPILAWLRSIDPLWLPTIQGVSIVGLGQYIPSSNSQTPSLENAFSVDDLESYLHDGGHYEDGGSWNDCVRTNLGLSCKTKGKTAKLEIEFKDKLEYQTSPDILEYKEKVVFKRDAK
ncbi:hypothetical protein TI39_contig341g00008 [Zymoseptoria brevis]|uniref:Uncharacterized protein n=1 Tax=Zymoseptoria brevis TaxID=1047168 RepID=A0A0F4GRV3_9PEZI|nr:hypothetical protein TI39_contig341g00008 [Zymoseptoria brevis]